ncbi:MAG: M13 family metallopeptidase [Proteobacteria bacterium]|nr:M13 family metallopeptidase [Pseudomonadota bacterium]
MQHRLFKPLALAIGLGIASLATAADFDVGLLSPQIKPCQDFAGYVNAKWNAANPIPADQTRWGAFNVLHEKSLKEQHQIAEDAAKNTATATPGSIEQKIGLLYAAGMDETAIEKAGFEPIQPRLALIAALKNNADIAPFLDASFNEGRGYVFDFDSGADFKDATRQIGFVSQDGLGLPTRDYYLKPEHKDLRAAYVAYIAKAFELTGTPATQAKTQADSVLAFETELARASLAPTELRDLDNQYHFVSVAEADAISPHFSWEKFFAAQGVVVGKGFSLSQPKFIAEFDKLLATAPLAQWQAYLRFHTISAASPQLSKAFVENHFDFYNKTLRGQPEQQERWKRVLGAIDGAMGMGMGELYVARYFPPAAKQRAEVLVANVRNALKDRIEHLEWMSAETKKKALDKWALFLPKIGYPDAGEWRDWSGLHIEPGNWFADLRAAGKYNYHYRIGKIGKASNRKEWHMTPQTVNAYYDPTTNTINFPAAILQPPFFHATGDDALNYGGIGAVIGHEASHGFDDQGSQFDGNGNRADWWTAADKQQFEARTGKLVKQFDAYAPIAGKPDLHINGKLTLGENIADLGGVNIAYDALQAALRADPKEAGEKIDGFTQDQRFFLNWATVWHGTAREKTAELMLNVDPHSPAAVRAFAAPSNMPQFANAFSCKAGDAMVRHGDKQVKIW